MANGAGVTSVNWVRNEMVASCPESKHRNMHTQIKQKTEIEAKEFK